MARPSEHTPARRLRAARRALVARYYRAGLSYGAIAARLHEEPGLERTSRSTVCADVHELLAEWRSERLGNIDDYVTLELRRIDDATAALWCEWERSRAEGRGEVAYIAEVRHQLAERRKLLGLYAPERREISGPAGGAVPLAGLTAAEIEAELARLAAGMPAAATVYPTGEEG